MKILTLNTHSLCEKEATFKRKLTALWIAEQQPDVICLQEVNQTITDSEVCVDVFFAGKDTIKQDNYANDLVQDLLGLGHQYHWIWEPVKIGYGKYEEGLAILSKTEILDHESILLTHTDDFNNWKKRKALGVKIQINNNNNASTESAIVIKIPSNKYTNMYPPSSFQIVAAASLMPIKNSFLKISL